MTGSYHHDDCDDDKTTGAALDGIVEGTTGADLIDGDYTGDPEGDMVDHGDAMNYGTNGSDDDYILAGAGNDTVIAGNGNDTVEGGAGDDLIKGDSGEATGGTSHVLDFNDLSKGEVVGNQYSAQGVTISSATWNEVMAFDTDCPTGGDTDLATGNLDNVLIISEDNSSRDPDDNASGGTFVIEFDSAADVDSLTFLDVEEGGTIKFYDTNGDLIETQSIDCTSNGGQNVQSLDVSGVARMEVTLNGSGAIDNLAYSFPGSDAEPGDDLLIGGEGDDTILGEEGDDTIYGGADDDSLDGGDGDDVIYGDSDGGHRRRHRRA